MMQETINEMHTREQQEQMLPQLGLVLPQMGLVGSHVTVQLLDRRAQ